MKKLKKAQEDRADKLNQFEALTKAAEGRELTELETSQLETLNDEIEALEKEIKSLESIQNRSKLIAQAAAVGPVQDNASEEKELKQYSWAKAARTLSKRQKFDGFEEEMRQEAVKEAQDAGVSIDDTGICVPSRMIAVGKRAIEKQTRILTVGTEGADVVRTEYKPMIPFLHIMPVVDRLGITIYNGLKGNLKIPRSTNDIALAWETETGAANDNTLTFDAVDLSPKRLAGYTDVTLQMLVQSDEVTQQYVLDKFAYAYKAAIDTAVIAGPTGGDSPVGILNYSGVNVVSLGTSGGDMTHGALVEMIAAPYADNAEDGNDGFLINTNGWAALMRTPKQSSGVEGNFILKPEEKMLLGRPFIRTNRVPNDLTETTTGLSGAIFSPRWKSAILGVWGGVNIIVDPYTQAGTGTVRFVLNAFADVDLEHPEEFAVVKDWNTTLPATT